MKLIQREPGQLVDEPHINILVLTHEETQDLFEYFEQQETDRNICCIEAECSNELAIPSEFQKSNFRLEAKAEFLVEESGYFYIFAINCQQVEYTLDGTVDILNPYGYVPGVDGMLLLVTSR